MTDAPAIPPRSARLSPTRRLLRTALVALLPLSALIASRLFLMVSHHAITPTFERHLRASPAPAEAFAPPRAAVVLSDRGSWSTGTVDPFSLADDDPARARRQATFELKILHGADVLLELRQEVAVAEDRTTGERAGCAIRTSHLAVGEGMQAVARVFVHEPEKILETSRGEVTFEVVLGAAGGGDERSSANVISGVSNVGPEYEIGLAGPARMAAQIFAKLWQNSDPPPPVLHRVRAGCRLSWRQFPGGSQGLGRTGFAHEPSTAEYSYDVRTELTDGLPGSGPSSEQRWRSEVRWRGRVW